MGGGNAQKSATARARKMKEEAGSKKGSQLKTNSAAQSIMCNICRQTFLCTAQMKLLQEHAANKHSKQKFEECFPGKS